MRVATWLTAAALPAKRTTPRNGRRLAKSAKAADAMVVCRATMLVLRVAAAAATAWARDATIHGSVVAIASRTDRAATEAFFAFRRAPAHDVQCAVCCA